MVAICSDCHRSLDFLYIHFPAARAGHSDLPQITNPTNNRQLPNTEKHRSENRGNMRHRFARQASGTIIGAACAPIMVKPPECGE
ncbi:hypothetical protein F7R13_22765 [Burkholderia territorii]|uniref:Uncharacterized protein n=1 Tax=Burkholderia territorii TaxID=1503055 RepID=A0A6L3NC22_9BURK|nr:hypothetical protein F7R13_22765 [Burkholderia territorii]